MDNQESIKTLRELRRETNDPWYEEVYDKAVSALEKQIPKELGSEEKRMADLVDRRAAIEQKKAGEWEMFELITSVYYGKQYYFKQDNGIVYSRASCKYMPVDDAVKEFLDVIGE